MFLEGRGEGVSESGGERFFRGEGRGCFRIRRGKVF